MTLKKIRTFVWNILNNWILHWITILFNHTPTALHFAVILKILYYFENYKEITIFPLLIYSFTSLVIELFVINKYHDQIGHLGVGKTLEIILKNYWFPSMK